MKQMRWIGLVILVFFSFQVSNAMAAQDEEITVFNPRGIKPDIRKIPMASRPEILDGMTIYIVDTKYPNTKPFVEELHAGLKNKYPKTHWILKDKIGSYMQDDPDLWKEIKANAQGAVILLGH